MGEAAGGGFLPHSQMQGFRRVNTLPPVGPVSAKGQIVKTNVGTVKRSRLYHLINPIVPINHVLKARVDIWGVVAMIGLGFGTVTLVRLFLLWVQ